MTKYTISNAQQLQQIVNDPTGEYELLNDIFLTGIEWATIPTFSGVLDGKGFTIYDLFVNGGGGFIDLLYKGVIKNLNFSNANVLGNQTATGIIARRAKGEGIKPSNEVQTYYYVKDAPRIINCKVQGTVRSSSSELGGLFGRTESDVTPSRWDDDKMINLFIQDTHVDVQIYAFSNYVGGIVGNASGGIDIERSSAKGNIYNANDYVGGFIGASPYYRNDIEDSYSIMDVRGQNHVGGFQGICTSSHYQAVSWNTSYFAGVVTGNIRGSVLGTGVTQGNNIIVDVEKLGFSYKDYSHSSNRPVVEFTTSQMSDIRNFYARGWKYYTVWFDDFTSDIDSPQLVSELPLEDFQLEGLGTVENPYLIYTIEDFLLIEKYNTDNQYEARKTLLDETDPKSSIYKPNYQFSNMKRYHYKLMNDINFNVYPFNTSGWNPICRYFDGKQNNSNVITFPVYDSEGKIIGVTSDKGVTVNKNTLFSNTEPIFYGFIGNIDGNDKKILNLNISDWVIDRAYPSHVGLFAEINGGNISRLLFENTNLKFDIANGIRQDGKIGRPSSFSSSFNISVGILTPKLSGNSKVEKIGVKGTVRLKHYASDVGGAGYLFGGLIGYYTSSPNTRGDLVNLGVVNDSYTQLAITVYNVNSNWGKVSPFIHVMNNLSVNNSYSASTIKIEQSVIGSYTPVDVGVFSASPSNKVLRCYFDSDIIGVLPNLKEKFVTGEVEINGRGTNAMKLRSTYAGWNFERVWQVKDINYPSNQPYDPNYVEPVNKTEYMVKGWVDSPYTSANSVGEHKKIQKIVVKNYTKKMRSVNGNKKKGTATVTANVPPLYAISFKYEPPVKGERFVNAQLIELNAYTNQITKRKKENILTANVSELNASATSSGINRGDYFNAIEIESIKDDIVIVKVNNSSVSELKVGTNSYLTNSESRYIIIKLDKDEYVMGNNLVEIKGYNFNNEEVVVKKINVEKRALPHSNMVGNKVIVDNKRYNVLSHNVPTGKITLSEPLLTDVKVRNNNDELNKIEVVSINTVPMVSITKDDTVNFVNGELLKSTIKGSNIEEEYEFIGEGDKIVTKIDSSRSEKMLAVGSFDRYTRFEGKSRLTNLTQAELNDTTTAKPRSEYINPDNTVKSNSGYVMSFGFDVYKFVIENMIKESDIPASTITNRINWVKNNVKITVKLNLSALRYKSYFGGQPPETIQDYTNVLIRRRNDSTISVPTKVDYLLENETYMEQTTSTLHYRLFYENPAPFQPEGVSSYTEVVRFSIKDVTFTVSMTMPNGEVKIIDDIKQVFEMKDKGNTTI